MIKGDMTARINCMSALMFTKPNSNIEELINNNLLYPRILMTTARSIGARLDPPDGHSFARVVFSTSVLEMVHEIG